MIFLAHLLKSFICHEFLETSCKWGVSFNNNVIFIAKFYCILLPKERMSFDLIYNRNLLCILKKMLKMSFHKIAHTNIFDFTFLFQFYQSFPCLKSNFCIFRILNFDFAYSRPMDQKEIKIHTIESLYDCLTC